MNNVTSAFKQLYIPRQALLVYQHADKKDHYVESYDIDKFGRPVNAHPLSEKEAEKLAKSLAKKEDKKKPIQSYLKSEGLLPEHVLYVNTEEDGYAIWYTPAQEQSLFFIDSLTIPNGKAHVPALLWKAYRQGGLSLFALKSDKRPTAKTKLYHAPFFNTASTGSVCMGSVKRDIPAECSLEGFMSAWQTYFFNSYFSHANGHAMTKTNIVQIWQEQIRTGQPFPANVLQESKTKLTSLLAR